MKNLLRRRWDSIAAIVLLLYGFIAASTQFGVSVAGQGLDPAWAAARARGSLRVAVEYGYFPFTDIKDGEPRGYDIDLARAVAQKLGLRAEFVGSGLDAIYDDLAGGKAELAASALPYAPEQSWRVLFSEFYFNAGQVLVVPEDSPITSEAQLPGVRLGAPLGSDADTYARALASRVAGIELFSEYDTPTEVLAALRRGELDAAIVDNAAALIDTGHTPGLRIIDPALTLEPYVLAMPVDAFTLHTEVNRALAELRREGFFEQNGKKWFVDASE